MADAPVPPDSAESAGEGDSTGATPSGGLGGALKVGCLNLGILILLLCLAEGAASVLLRLNRIRAGQSGALELAEVHHTTYDTLLGWANRPDVSLPDFYGDGIGLQTNARGFRGATDFGDAAPPGVTRIVCVGDSFTLGFGVADDDSWCAHLARDREDREAVNMGQGGYGVGQAFLWYDRDATFDHDLVVFAFIADDFFRMRRTQFLGYDKPRLAVDGDSTVATNVPVPETSFQRAQAPAWLRTVPDALRDASLYRLARMFTRGGGGGDGASAEEGGEVPYSAPPRPEDLELVRALFTDLHRTVQRRGARLAAVYLPERDEFAVDTDLEWRAAVEAAANEHGFAYWDLVPDLRENYPNQAPLLYLTEEDGGRDGAPGHFNVAGNAAVAALLERRMEAWEDPASP